MGICRTHTFVFQYANRTVVVPSPQPYAIEFLRCFGAKSLLYKIQSSINSAKGGVVVPPSHIYGGIELIYIYINLDYLIIGLFLELIKESNV